MSESSCVSIEYNSQNDDSLYENNYESGSVPPNAVLIKRLAPQHPDRLYAKILKSKDITYVVSHWLSEYSLDKDEAIYELYQLCVDLSAYQNIDVKNFVENRNISELIPCMDKSPNIITAYTNKYFLIMQNKLYKIKHAQIEEFIMKFIEMTNKEKILYDSILFYKLIDFFVHMSESNVRSIKHTGVYFALKYQTGLVCISSKIVIKISSLQKSHENETNEEAKLYIEKKMEKLENYNDVVNKMILFLQNKVFKKNWNFKDPKLHFIREECILELYTWMEVYPGRYIQPENLNFIIAAISDQHKTVRSTAIEIAGNILTNYNSSIRLMAPKLIESIAKHIRDIDYKVSILAVDTLTTIRRHLSLPSHIRQILCSNIYNVHYPLAAACGKYLAELITDKNSGGDEGLLRLLLLFESKAISRGFENKYPLLIEAIYDYLPVLQDINAYMKLLDTDLVTNDVFADIWLNILTESCQQTFTGQCSFKRNQFRNGTVKPETVKNMIKELMRSLNKLISVFGLDKLSALLLLMRDHMPQDFTAVTIDQSK